jgi:hypothetical protein
LKSESGKRGFKRVKPGLSAVSFMWVFDVNWHGYLVIEGVF